MRFVLAWALFLIGDGISRMMRISAALGFLYPAYNRFMGWSSIVQGPSSSGPWSEIVEP